jgi:hypothetical protein
MNIIKTHKMKRNEQTKKNAQRKKKKTKRRSLQLKHSK